jgi:hypothetical protein
MKPSPSKPTVSNAIIAIADIIQNLGGHDISTRPSLLEADVKENVVPTLIDARRGGSRYSCVQIFLKAFVSNNQGMNTRKVCLSH